MAVSSTLFDLVPAPDEFVAALERSQTLFGWAQAIEELPPGERHCQNYWKPLGEAADAAQSAGDEQATLVCVLLNAFCFNPLHEDSPSRPFGDTIDTIARNVREGRPPGSGLLPDNEEEPRGWGHPIAFLRLEHYDLLRTIAPELGDADLRARVADILWIVRRDYRIAQLAVESYLESARVLAEGEHWPYPADCLKRALRLARSLGRSNTSFPRVLAEVEAAINIPLGAATFFSAELMATLLSIGAGDAGCVRLWLKPPLAVPRMKANGAAPFAIGTLPQRGTRRLVKLRQRMLQEQQSPKFI